LGIIARAVEYKGLLIVQIDPSIKKSDPETCHLSIDNDSVIGQIVFNTKVTLGISKEAREFIDKMERVGDDIGDVDWFQSDNGHWNFGWIGPMTRIIGPNSVCARGTRIPAAEHYIDIPNDDPPEEQKKEIDEVLAEKGIERVE
jgi:hypothetical protein